jgi:hypothetical protein
MTQEGPIENFWERVRRRRGFRFFLDFGVLTMFTMVPNDSSHAFAKLFLIVPHFIPYPLPKILTFKFYA